jgi:type IV pilus assembly protein PilM
MYETNYGLADRQNIALVNIGASKTNINILRKGLPIFLRDTAIGSNYHTEALERALNIPKETAEKLKMGEPVPGIDDTAVKDIVGGASDEIYAEIYRSFEYFRSSISNEDINTIILSGGAALVGGFAHLMGERLGIPVEVADPFRKIIVPERLLPTVRPLAPLAGVVVGLALRRAGDRQ